MPRFTLEKTDGRYRVGGDLNEHTVFDAIRDDPAAVIDVSFRHVSSINSIGVARLAQLSAQTAGKTLRLHELPSFLARMASTVPALFDKHAAHLASWFVPYNCAKCDVTSEIVVRREDVKQGTYGFTAPAKRCTSCRGPLAVEGHEDDYFLFLTYAA